MLNNKIILIVLIVSIISIVKSLNINASTNTLNFSTDYPLEKEIINYDSLNNTYELLLKEKSVFDSQWDILCDRANKIPASISENKDAYILLDELIKRTKNKTDPLNNLKKYEPIFSLGGAAPLTIYGIAYNMYYRSNDFRSVKLFLFLISEDNPNKFTVGNSYYWLGKFCMNELKDKSTAFKYFMTVHKYPACLVFTANSYIFASEILVEMRQQENANALLAIDVPTYDFDSIKEYRHLLSYGNARFICDYTNAIRHYQVACIYNTNNISSVETMLKSMPSWCREYWNVAISNPWSEIDVMLTINKGLSNPRETPDDDLFFDALAHEWPSVENVPSLILTNRLLSNNIFPQKRKIITNVEKRKIKHKKEEKL